MELDTNLPELLTTPELLPSWRDVLKEQGRKMTWLALKTDTAYPTVQSYAYGLVKAPEAWLAKVSELLGEPVR